ncbi:MAG: hypothetical protein ACYTGQ_15040 [Planctomycetota bacterium]|jgi:hypothetical protein
MDRRRFTLGALVSGSGLVMAGSVMGTEEAGGGVVGLKRFEVGLPVEIELESEAVEWRGNAYRLLNLKEIVFALDEEERRLTAEITGGVTMFDDVDYDVSAAVFDRQGVLLGAARAVCEVQRLWVGVVLNGETKVWLDFGVSNRYAEAERFVLSISERDVLTPDDWQE